MFGSVTLEVAVGMIFLFVLVSMLCSSIREGMESLLKTRAAYLERGIRELLQDKEGRGLAKSFYEHPLIYSLYFNGYTPGKNTRRPPILAKGKDLPSYIPSKNFARVLMDIAARGAETDEVSGHPQSPVISPDVIRSNIMNIDNPFVQRAMLTAIDSAQGDLNTAQKKIEEWYDSAMDRVSGWYKRSTQWILFWIGLTMAVLLNVNTIAVADHLYRNDGKREALVARAEAAARDTAFQSKNFEEAKDELSAIGLPIGWSSGSTLFNREPNAGKIQVWNDILAPVLGWLLTALAATMGAPFWFDLLNKVMVIRSTVKPHEKSQEEDSEDRQLPKRRQAILHVREPQANPREPGGDSSATTISPRVPNIRDRDTNIDGCDLKVTNSTPDDQLPPAQGGVV